MAEFITNHVATLSVSAKKQYNTMKQQRARRHNGTHHHHVVVPPPTKQNHHHDNKNHHNMIHTNPIQFLLRNAEDTQLPHQSYDLVTVMYAFHEAPHQGRHNILKEARRILSPGGILAVIDISTQYQPSPHMLRGEPYVQEYQNNIHRQLTNIAGFERPKYQDIVPHHLGMWTLKRSALAY
jgi:ubiquinone/menaquinone biosynthesis C-methylase UbiE